MAKVSLSSDSQVANENSTNLLSAVMTLNELPSVSLANTNAAVNEECGAAYDGVKTVLSSYSEVAGRDAERIRTIASQFTLLDQKLSGALMKGSK